MPNLLIEIGVEELPVGSLDVIYDELALKARQKLVDERIAFDDVKVEATPRRIALFIAGITVMQPDREFEVSGPSHEKCYDGQGKPTAVLQGFLKSKQATEKDIEIRETPKGKFVFLKKKEKGRPVAALLPELIKSLFASLSFPKLMRWESTSFRFPRPIRWLVVLMDGKKIPMVLADVKSGNKSFGHRFLFPQGFVIPKADWKAYIALLRKKHVYLPLEVREALVRGALKNRFGQKQIDEELIHMNAQLVEEPFFLSGTFSQEYLELPAEVLASCMKKNQKVFACYDPKGQLKSQFIAVMNGKRGGLAKIRADYEGVLDSRLKDARYFYEMDTKESFEKKKPKLAELVYLAKCGSMLDKTNRLEELAPEFAKITGYPELAADLARVASLSKIDLVTHLVYEMPDLQGIVGREYAREAKEKEDVAAAIGVQYLPKNLTEDYRKVKNSISLLGALFGIMDRLDFLVGAFGAGIEPTGSKDPFALRRAGGVMVKLIRAFNISFPLGEILRRDLFLFESVKNRFLLKEVGLKPVEFLKDRVSFELGVKPGTRSYEILQAVMRTSFENIAEVFKRYEALTGMDEKVLIKAAKVVQRTANMLKGYGKTPGEPKQELLSEEQEKKIYELILTGSKEVEGLFGKGEYEKATRVFADIFLKPVNDFFDQVLVNAEDAALRENRMALVARINRVYTAGIADLSALSRIDEE